MREVFCLSFNLSKDRTSRAMRPPVCKSQSRLTLKAALASDFHFVIYNQIITVNEICQSKTNI